jgi:hypothetical protein
MNNLLVLLINKPNMMKKLLTTFLFLFFIFSVYGQMHIIDPQSWWGEEPASIENIEIEVRTLGAYSETAIAFDIKLSENGYFGENDLLEFTFDFKLKEGAVVNDSWLWIHDYISKGEVYEQGEGTQIYESIVDRQQDPSILTQISSMDYNLRVYPLKWDSTRRVRISYLAPLDYFGKKANTTLPLGLLQHSDQSPEQIKVIVFEDEYYVNDGLNSDDWMLEEVGSDYKVYRNTYVFDHSELDDMPLSFTFKDPDTDYFLSTYEGAEDKYYQLVYFPVAGVESSVENRMIVFDYDSFTSKESFDEIKDELRAALKNMEEKDHFIICTADFTTKFSSEEWVSATSDNIEKALSEITQKADFLESRLTTLLPEALNRVEELNQEAEIIVLSPNNEYYTEQKANAFLSLIISFYDGMTTETTISSVDYARTKPSGQIDGLTYFGNDYLYQKLAEVSNGIYYSKGFGDDIYSSLVDLFTTSLGYTDQFDFHLSIEDGFTYSNFTNLKSTLQVGGGKPIISTGKYIGEGLFEVIFTAKWGDQVYSEAATLDPQLSIGLDERAKSIWHSEWIKFFQRSGDDDVRRAVIETSIEERLLSLHTVFLCLEPDLESISANNGEDGEIFILSTEEANDSDVGFKIYPNPFIGKLSIAFPLEKISSDDEVVIKILDSKGQLIDRIIKSKGLVNGLNLIEWEPPFDLTDGIYVIQIQINNRVYHQKVLHMNY